MLVCERNDMCKMGAAQNSQDRRTIVERDFHRFGIICINDVQTTVSISLGKSYFFEGITVSILTLSALQEVKENSDTKPLCFVASGGKKRNPQNWTHREDQSGQWCCGALVGPPDGAPVHQNPKPASPTTVPPSTLQQKNE